MAKATKAPHRKGNGPPDPTDHEAFQKWLLQQPPEWSVTIAARAALRVLPLVRGDKNLAAIALPVFRATAIAWFAAKYPNRSIEVAPAALAAATSAATSGVAAATAADAAYAANAATPDVYAAYAISAAIHATRDPTTILTAIKQDVQLLHEGLLTAQQLARAPLWLFPAGEFVDRWQRLALKLNALGGHWRVWTDWYEDVSLEERHKHITDAGDASFTDLPGALLWDDGAKAVNVEIARRLQALGPDPTPAQGIPSPIAIMRMADGRIGADLGNLGETASPASFTPEDHIRALAACRSRAHQLQTLAASPEFQGRSDYAEALAAYLEWLPSAPGSGNILLADGEARVLNKLFTADEGILPTGFAGRLSVLLEDHIGLRPHYPELERHYQAVRTGRLTAPLSRDAVEGIRQAIHANTPVVFHESVSPAMDETAKLVPDVKPPLPEDAPPPDPTRPKPPKDPIAQVDPVKSRNFTFASGANRIWEILKKGKDAQQGTEGWQKTYEQFKPHIGTIIDWLKDFWPGGDGGMPPMAG
jgi:hypothetical protein